jgi:hypothetical protein
LVFCSQFSSENLSELPHEDLFLFTFDGSLFDNFGERANTMRILVSIPSCENWMDVDGGTQFLSSEDLGTFFEHKAETLKVG